MKKFNINSFLNLSPEEQAKAIERQTKELIKRLPELKKQLKMYGEQSSELYNLNKEEVELMGTTYSKAIRGGEISTPSSKKAYSNFIKNLHKYTKRNINQLALETAEERLASWKEHLDANASAEERAYAQELLDSMTPSEKIGFTRSEYFLDVENWNSQGFVQETSQGDFSMMTLKLELYLQKTRASGMNDVSNTRNIYNTDVATDGENKLRAGVKGKKVHIKRR